MKKILKIALKVVLVIILVPTAWHHLTSVGTTYPHYYSVLLKCLYPLTNLAVGAVFAVMTIDCIRSKKLIDSNLVPKVGIGASLLLFCCDWAAVGFNTVGLMTVAIYCALIAWFYKDELMSR